jgi:RNA polymerase sigma-70 factor (ECF subfamily)
MHGDSLSEIKGKLPELMPRLWRFAIMLTRNEDTAEDLVQSACLRMLEKANAYSPNSSLDRWAFTVMANLHRSTLRRQKGRQKDGDEALAALPDEAPSPLESIFHDQVMTAIAGLSTEQRAVVTLVCAEGYTYQQTAEILETPIGTVMSRLHAARRRLGWLREDGDRPRAKD